MHFGLICAVMTEVPCFYFCPPFYWFIVFMSFLIAVRTSLISMVGIILCYNSVMSFVLILSVCPFWMSFSTYRSWNHTQKTLTQYWNNGEIINRLYPLMVPYYSVKIFHKFFWSRAIGPGHHGVSLKAKLMRRKIQYDVLPERYLYLWYCL